MIRPGIIGLIERTSHRTAGNTSAHRPWLRAVSRFERALSLTLGVAPPHFLLFVQTLIERDFSADEDNKSGAGGGANGDDDDQSGHPESKLDSRVQELIKLIADLKMMKEQMIEVGYDGQKKSKKPQRSGTSKGLVFFWACAVAHYSLLLFVLAPQRTRCLWVA